MRLGLPKAVKHWSLRSVHKKLGEGSWPIEADRLTEDPTDLLVDALHRKV